jgi:hypothetical protein
MFNISKISRILKGPLFLKKGFTMVAFYQDKQK